jgi:hypothetical protein
MTITLTESKLAIEVLAVVMLAPASAWATHVSSDVPDGKSTPGRRCQVPVPARQFVTGRCTTR